MKVLLVVLRQKSSFGAILLDHFLLFVWAWLKLRQATVTIGSLNSQDIISFMITTGYSNSLTLLGSLNSQDMISQVNIYVMDFVWILCDVYVWRSEFNRVSYGFVKLL